MAPGSCSRSSKIRLASSGSNCSPTAFRCCSTTSRNSSPRSGWSSSRCLVAEFSRACNSLYSRAFGEEIGPHRDHDGTLFPQRQQFGQEGFAGVRMGAEREQLLELIDHEDIRNGGSRSFCCNRPSGSLPGGKMITCRSGFSFRSCSSTPARTSEDFPVPDPRAPPGTGARVGGRRPSRSVAFCRRRTGENLRSRPSRSSRRRRPPGPGTGSGRRTPARAGAGRGPAHRTDLRGSPRTAR